MLITFIRHSKVVFDPLIPIKNWRLTAEGIVLVKDLLKLQAIKNIDVIYSSLETKALETASIIAKGNGLLIKTDSKLDEVTSFSNKLFPDFDKYAKDYWDEKVERWNNGETKREALDRFNKVIKEIVETEEKNKHSNVGIVTHGAILTLFTSQFYNTPQFDLQRKIKNPDIAVFDWEKQEFVHTDGSSNWWKNSTEEF